MGVYHLGYIVSESIARNKDEFVEIGEIDRYLKIFEFACLLHNFVIELTGDEDLEAEIKSKNYKAAPHELMSAIVALRDYSFLFQNDEGKSFFARCIIG